MPRIKPYTIKCLMKECALNNEQISDASVFALKFHIEKMIRNISTKAFQRLCKSDRKRLSDTDVRMVLKEIENNVL